MATAGQGLPTREEIERLPLFARVAFAARCARRALPMFREGWPEAPDEHTAAVDRAVEGAEAIGRGGSFFNDEGAARAAAAAGASRAASRAAADAADAAANAARAAEYANDVAARAVGFADSEPGYTDFVDTTASEAINAAIAARDTLVAAHAAPADVNVLATLLIRSDFDLLLRAATEHHWTDGTPVPPDFFPPLEANKTPPSNSGLPSAEEIEALPLWARVAYAARCARRVLPLFRKGWPDAPEEYIVEVNEVVEFAETAAANAFAGKASVSPIEVHNIATFAVNAIAANAASAAANAARAARDAALVDRYDYANAVNHAVHAAAANAVHAAASSDLVIRLDFELLVRAAAKHHWTDDTPVPPDFFLPLSEAATPTAPSNESHLDDSEHTIRFEVPPGVSDEDLVATLKELFDAGDDLHRALGGHGIKLKQVSAGDHVPALVPSGGVQ